MAIGYYFIGAIGGYYWLLVILLLGLLVVTIGYWLFFY
jgi:hypothetical protein